MLTILATVVKNDLRLLQLGKSSRDRIIHICADIVRVDSSKACGMQIDQVVKVYHDFVHQIEGINLGGRSVRFTREQTISIQD